MRKGIRFWNSIKISLEYMIYCVFFRSHPQKPYRVQTAGIILLRYYLCFKVFCIILHNYMTSLSGKNSTIFQ